ncbi:double-strand break repair protein AddB [Paracoccus sp. Z118]|uniref:double-strand break repair protein AddB n=1 Tax=Paracoccus sp. Z118 TaxID=2851017 RepID=UPI001C2B91B2|nr:double-strand break repair protein AddB [Paracoccus sp. Z118]MBV0891093.1 double-strand break repair protein AddB [Paracoccus sp. Z118]
MAEFSGLYAVPPGADFASAFAGGLLARMADQPPEALARVTIYANSGRTLTALRAAFEVRGPLLLPRLRLLADLGAEGAEKPLAAPLARRMQLARLIEAVPPEARPGQSVPELAASLSDLMAEMQSEGLGADALDRIETGDHAIHWQRALAFLRIAAGFHLSGPTVDREARQRRAAERLAAGWAAGRNLPDGPVIVAGSTGSHGGTRLFMQAVAGLPNGAVVVPGFDFATPAAIWDRLDTAEPADDHPQARFAPLVRQFGMPRPWADAPAPDPARERLISLALRPAPVTDQWVAEGPSLGDLLPATERLTLIEADQPADEADAIALLIRGAVERGEPVTLIASDRSLTRRVQAALDRWRLIPDDSAGQPLPLTAAGLFLRHVAALFGQPLTIDRLLVILKHPLTATGSTVIPRNRHLLQTRELELELRRNGPAFPDGASLLKWGERNRRGTDAPDPDRLIWSGWVAAMLDRMAPLATDRAPRPLEGRLADHRALAEALAAGPQGDAAASELWAERPGELARAVMDHMAEHAPLGPAATARDYADLLTDQMQAQAVRQDVAAHSLIRFRGPREARTEAVGLVILAGLNEGAWPQALAPDPWLSRQMRAQAGLTLPERRIGLGAHDFQIGLSATQVILTRARRNAEAETVPSRWLNRLVNLIRGLSGDQHGPEALAAMLARGQVWLDLARQLRTPPEPVPPQPRPSPIPPPRSLKDLSVTGVSRLIRDPYAIYADKILRLRALDPLRPEPDAAERGNVLHEIVRSFLSPLPSPLESPEMLRERLLAATDKVLARDVPWPAMRLFWRARIARIADRLAADEHARLKDGTPAVMEERHSHEIAGLGFRLTAKPDRIDHLKDGTAHVYDYKSGSLPTDPQIRQFDKQLPLEAALVQRGALGDKRDVSGMSYIRLGGEGETKARNCSPELIAETWDGFVALISAYLAGGKGFTARAAMQNRTDASDYDGISRYGEWTLADAGQPEKVGGDG